MMRRRELMGMQGKLKTVSGPIVTVNDALARNAKSLVVNFAPIQAAGTPAPDNVLPISGWTGLTGYRTGENLITTTPIRRVNRAKVDNSTTIVSDNYTALYVYPIPKGMIYVKNASTSNMRYYGLSNNPNLGIGDSIEYPWIFQWTNPSINNTDYSYLYCSSAKDLDFANACVTVIADSATGLDASTGTTYPVDWTDIAGTVYGGYVDLVSGVLVVTHQGYVYDGSEDEGWNTTTGSAYYIPNPNKVSQTFICDSYLGLSPRVYTSISDMACAMTSSPHNYINFKNSGITTLADWKASLALSPIKTVMKLATPVTYQLTPQTIAMPRGTNNVWSNANGDIELIYYAQ